MSKFCLDVWGGWAGQLTGLTYAFWLADRWDSAVHLRFFDGGTSLRALVVRDLLQTEPVLRRHISYEEIRSRDNRAGARRRFSVGLRSRGRLLSRMAAFRGAADPQGSMRLENLERRSAGHLTGYTNDFRVVEQGWPTLIQAVSESGLPNFTEGSGAEASVSIHWRLGDYIGNGFHGVIRAKSLIDCLAAAQRGRDWPVRLFTDSPDIALEALERADVPQMPQIQGGDIWDDVYAMSRSAVFIGNHSGVSLLVGMAILNSASGANVYMPNQWALDSSNRAGGLHLPLCSRRFEKYPVELTTEALPV